MNTEIKQKWIEALLSGKYEQGQGALRCSEEMIKHCCLGVICELGIEAGVVRRRGLGYGEDRDNNTLPIEVMKWVGIKSCEGRLIEPYVVEHDGDEKIIESLVDLNDNGYSFLEIARVIEDNGVV